MGSLGAMGQGSRDRYGQADVEDSKKLVPEGIEGQVLTRVRSPSISISWSVACAPAWATWDAEMYTSAKARFMQITAAGLREGHVHDVFITKEAPNYRVE